jgi:SAM-dependent methyltransferase
MESRRLTACRLCQADFYDFTVNLGKSPTANQLPKNAQEAKNAKRFDLEVGMCSSCKHIQLMDIVNPSILFSDYIYKSGTSATFVRHFTELAKIISELPLHLKYVLEVGSNDGTLLSKFKDRGVRAIGIEPSQILADECNKVGLETICSYFESTTMQSIVERFGKPSIIVGNNVFAHIDDLAKAFECAHDFLDPQGYFIFEVADVSKILVDGIFDTIYHEHMSYHSITSMFQFAKQHGFKIARIDQISTHGGSLRFFLTIDGQIDATLNLDELISRENLLDLNSDLALHKIADQIGKIDSSVKRVLDNLASDPSYALIGYGAPAKVVTFLSTLNIEDLPLLGIIDDNVHKQGKFLPGSGIKILSSAELVDELRSKFPEKRVACLVFPWNLGVEIQEKIASLFPPGSKLITFFPEVNEVEF